MHRRFVAFLSLLVALGLAQPSYASFHLMKVREVFTGTSMDGDIEYVVLQMYQGGQNQVGGHSVTFYDSAGSVVNTVTFAGAVANGATQSKILIATTQAETFFTVTADLVMPTSMNPNGGMVCFESIDCVSWGNYSGSSTSPSPSGTPFAPSGGILPGHAIRRDISHGNGSLLQDSDDTDDSIEDFDCAATATPENNAGASGSYMDPSPCPVCGNNTVELGEVCDGTDDMACPGGCQSSCTCPSHDSVVLPVKPIKLKVPNDAPMSVTKKIKVKVRNADTHNGSESISLNASAGTCPPGVSISTPDFNPPAMDNTATLGAGESASAEAFVTVTAAAFTTFNSQAPSRCVLNVTAATVVTGNIDPYPTNNSIPVELSVIDENDAEQNSSPNHESYIKSLKPLKIGIGAGATAQAKSIKPAFGNADILPAPDSGDAIALSVDISGCSAVSVTSLDVDRDAAGNQSSINVDGGDKARGTAVLAFSAAGISTPNPLSPYRCLGTVSVTGPSDPDPSPANNEAQLVLDIVDKNDQ